MKLLNEKIGPNLSRIFFRAIEYIETTDLLDNEKQEAISYVEEDIMFVAEANIPDYIFKNSPIKFHYTDQ